MSQVRVNVRTLANVKAVRKEKRNGRDVVIVPSATLPDDVVMNGIKYPADEIEKSYKQLERTPAPLGHPMINGKFVSSRDPEAINLVWVGAWNENVRRENGRVLLDKVIDVEIANKSEGGKSVLAAIEQGGPIHTSTGLYAQVEAVNGKGFTKIARNMVWDHDAILLNEKGAATPEQGVGMLVNAAGELEEIQVINSSLMEDIDREIDWAGSRLVEALKRREDVGTWERMKAAIMEALGFTEREPSSTEKEDDMTVSKEQFDALSAKVETLSEGMGKIGDTVAAAVANAVKPLVDAQAEIVANQKAKDDAELTELREKIVKANLMDEGAAKELTLNAARALAKQAEPGKAASLSNRFEGKGSDKPAFKLPKGE